MQRPTSPKRFSRHLAALCAATTMALTPIVALPAASAAAAGPVAIAAPTQDQFPSQLTGMVAPNATYSEGHLTSRDGANTQIFFSKNTVPNAKGTVVVVHGMAEHSARYDYVAYRLNQAGYNVYRIDHRGHGKSAQPFNGQIKGNVDSFAWLTDDLDQLVDMAHREQPGKLFMLGHSMGAMATQMYGTQHPDKVDGTISSGGGVPLNIFGANNAPIQYERLASLSPRLRRAGQAAHRAGPPVQPAGAGYLHAAGRRWIHP